MDEQLSEYEQENMALLAELETNEGVGAAGDGDAKTFSKKGLVPVGGADAEEHAGVVADLARAVAARDAMDTELRALKRAHTVTSEALTMAQVCIVHARDVRCVGVAWVAVAYFIDWSIH